MSDYGQKLCVQSTTMPSEWRSRRRRWRSWKRPLRRKRKSLNRFETVSKVRESPSLCHRVIVHLHSVKTRHRGSMIKSSRNRRSYSRGRRRSTRNRPKLTSRPASGTCWPRSSRQSRMLVERLKRTCRHCRMLRKRRSAQVCSVLMTLPHVTVLDQ